MKRKQKVLLIGWDGADWDHINPLIDGGLMPTFDAFINQGTIGNLATLEPVLSPMLWNSVATGKFADKHNILGFIEPNPTFGGAQPYSSVSRNCKALWNILSQQGIRSNIINWWASHPAEKIDGCIVSNLFHGVKHLPNQGWKITPGTIHPAEKEQDYAKFKMFPDELTAEHVFPFIPNADKIDQDKDKRITGFAKTFAEMMSTHAVATAVMENEPWDFMAIYYTGIDHFCHGFMQYHPPKMDGVSDEDFEIYQHVITGAYRFHDMMLERLLQLAGDDTSVIICSDHGFQSGEYRPTGTPREPAGPAVWHRKYGILAARGPGIKVDERIYGASLIDIGPTILQLFDLPVGEDMDGRPLAELFEQPPEIKSIESWENVDGNHGMHSGDIPMSESESEELLKQFVALGYVDELDGDKSKQESSARIESKYNLARCLMWQAKYDAAIGILREITMETPWETRFIVHLAEAFLKAGYFRQVIKLIDRAFNLEKTSVVQALIIYAKAKLALGEVQGAIGLLKSALERSPRFPSLFVQIGDVYRSIRQWDQAIRSYQKAISLHPEMAFAYQGLSTAYLRTGNYQAAVDAALDAVSLLYRLPVAHTNLGIALARAGENDRAILALSTAARFAPDSPHPHRILSRIYQNMGKTDMATQHRAKSQALVSASSISRKDLGSRKNTEFELPDFDTEIERAERIIRERPFPNDPVAKSGKKFVLVSGLPRSGTSLMMQMLAAGGLEVLTDHIRQPDEDNPKGYFEWEDIKKIAEQPDLLDNEQHNKKVIKTISMLLKQMPREHEYKVIFMMRPIAEVAESQEKMLTHRSEQGAELATGDLVRTLSDHRRSTINWMKEADHMDHLCVSYPGLIEDPLAAVNEISNFLGNDWNPNPQAMMEAIDHSLYRNRPDKH